MTEHHFSFEGENSLAPQFCSDLLLLIFDCLTQRGYPVLVYTSSLFIAKFRILHSSVREEESIVLWYRYRKSGLAATKVSDSQTNPLGDQ